MPTEQEPRQTESKMPQIFEPMIPSLTRTIPKPFKDWDFEAKLNGIRAITKIEAGKITIISRGRTRMTESFPEVELGLKKLALSHPTLVLDGELVCGQGVTRQERDHVIHRSGRTGLSAYHAARNTPAYYVIFDILFLGNEDLRNLPLVERKKYLRRVVTKNLRDVNIVTIDPYIKKQGVLFDEARKMGIEGVVFKRKESTYRGGRNRNWLKYKF